MLPIIKYRKIWFIFSGTLVLASFLALAVWHLRLGTDFTGGSLLEVKWNGGAPTVETVQNAVRPLLNRDFVVQPGQNNSTIIRTEALNEQQHQDILKELKADGTFDELRFDSIGPVLGVELFQKSLWALLIVFIGIILYISWSFRRVTKPVSSWMYGIVTIITGFHDVAFPLGLFAVLGHFYNVEVNAGFVAAILTVLGYSINDTIVVLDRIRENLSHAGLATFDVVVEASVNQTIARSVNTSTTALLALIAIYFFGGTTTKDFSLALIVGIATGTYSSIFIASPLLVAWQRIRGNRSVK